MKLGGWSDFIYSSASDSWYDPTTGQALPADAYTAYDLAINNGTVDPAVFDGTTVSTPATGVASTDWVKLITTIAPSIPAYITAFQLSQVNVARAKAGMQPLNTAAYGPQVGVSLSPQTSQLITYGLIGFAAVFMLTRNKGA